jgi:hypothetical protein
MAAGWAPSWTSASEPSRVMVAPAVTVNAQALIALAVTAAAKLAVIVPPLASWAVTFVCHRLTVTPASAAPWPLVISLRLV